MARTAVKVKFKDNSGKFIESETQKLSSATEKMCQSVRQLAQILAPVDTGDLRASGRVEREGEVGHSVVFGGQNVKVPYAKRRHYENRKNPQTLRYLERAGEAVVKKGIKSYLK